MSKDTEVITVEAKQVTSSEVDDAKVFSRQGSDANTSDHTDITDTSPLPDASSLRPQGQSWYQAVVWYTTHPQQAVQDMWSWIKNHPDILRRYALIAGSVVIAVGTIAAFWLVGRYNAIGDVRAAIQPPVEGSVVYDRNGEVLFNYFDVDQQRESVAISEIPEEMQLAIIALEDENFYTNPVGIPWQNMVGASFQCLFGDDCRGGSGLSQQLVKNATGDDDRSVDRKLNELMTAIKLNQELNSQDILELYLNYVPFGRNTYGVQQGSKAFFGKAIDEKDAQGQYTLTLPQACMLASIPQRPTSHTQGIEDYVAGELESDFWIRVEARKNICLRKLHELDLQGDGQTKIATEAELRELQESDLGVVERSQEPLTYGHLRIYIANELENKLGVTEDQLSSQGYKITTTFDKKIQDDTQRIIAENTERIQQFDANNAAAVILDGPSGGVVAMVGSRDFNNVEIGGQVNVALSPRQPGSSFKPYVMASAFQKGFHPGTPLVNLRTDFGNYAPTNLSRNTPAITSLRYTLANSLNIPSVKGAYLSQQPSGTPNATGGIAEVLALTDNAGVQTPLRTDQNCGLTSTLGTCEVTALSHAGGINTLLHDGILNEPHPFVKVELTQRDIFSDRGIIRDIYAEQMASSNPPYATGQQAMDTLAARQVTHVMADYGARDPRVWGNARFNLELPGWSGANSVAAKTGTTSDVRDTWTVGGSPVYTIATWVGNTDNSPMNSRITSSSTAAPIWKQLMESVHTGITPTGFNYDGLQQVRIDPNTGYQVSNGGTIELMTPTQLQLIQQAQNRIAQDDFDVFSSNIFETRSAVVPVSIKVNVADGKRLPADAQLPEEFVETIQCRAIVSAFPTAPFWFQPAQDEANRRAENPDYGACPTEVSDVSVDGLVPIITVNAQDNTIAPQILQITAQSANPTGNIVSLTVTIDEVIIADLTNTDSIEIDWMSEGITGTADIVIAAEDEFGQSIEQTIAAVDFDDTAYTPSPLETVDLATLQIDCTSVTAGDATACTITLPPFKTIPTGFRVYIGNSTIGGTCNSAGVCNIVPTDAGDSSTTVDVQASISGGVASAVATASTLALD